MNTNEIIGLSSSALLSVAGLIFNESIKEIIKKHFALKSKKKINKLFWSIFLIAISLPIVLLIFTPYVNKTDTKRIISAPQSSNGIEQIPNH